MIFVSCLIQFFNWSVLVAIKIYQDSKKYYEQIHSLACFSVDNDQFKHS